MSVRLPIKFAPLLCALAVSQAQAGGLWITEYGQPTMGRAGAGEQTGTGSAADAFLNPASMARHDHESIMLTGGFIAPQMKFDVEQTSLLNGSNNGGTATEPTAGASAFYVRPINDDWTVGLSAIAMTGSSLDFNKQWVGRFQAQKVELLVAGLVPSVAYKVNDKFSLGFAVPIMYANLDMKLALPGTPSPQEDPEGELTVNGDDVQVAPSASFLYEISDSTRLGGRVSGELDFKFDGDTKIKPAGLDVSSDTEIPMAALARIGLSHDFNDKWTGHATWGWDNWSALGGVTVTTPNRHVVLPTRWRDTYHYALGADYHLDSRWTLRAGAAFDTNPVDSNDRNAQLPVDEQIRYAIGADYARENGMVISGSLVYADYGDARINTKRQGELVGFSGDFTENNIWFASVSFNLPLGEASR